MQARRETSGALRKQELKLNSLHPAKPGSVSITVAQMSAMVTANARAALQSLKLFDAKPEWAGVLTAKPKIKPRLKPGSHVPSDHTLSTQLSLWP